MAKKENLKIKIISTEKIEDNPDQTRIFVDQEGIENLANSIRENGIIQPILVRKEGDKVYLVAGQRRLEAAKLAEKEEVPVCFLNEVDPLEIGLIENLQRENLHPIDESEGLIKLQDKRKTKDANFTQDDLGLIIGKAQNTVSEILILGELTKEIREETRKDSRFTRSMLLPIARNKDKQKMKLAFEKLKKKLDQSKDKKTEKSNLDKLNIEVALRRLNLLQESLGKIKISKVTGKNKTTMKSLLESVQTSISETLKFLE